MPTTLYKSSYKRPNRRDSVKALTERTRSASRSKKSNDYGNYSHILQPLTSHQITQRQNLVPRQSTRPYMKSTESQQLKKSYSEQNLVQQQPSRPHTALPKRTVSKLQQPSHTAVPSRRNSITQTSQIDSDANKWLNILNKVFDRLDSSVSDKNKQNTGIAPVSQPIQQQQQQQQPIMHSTIPATQTTTQKTEIIEPNIQPNLRTLKQRLQRNTAPLYTDHSTVHIKSKPSTNWRTGQPNPTETLTENTSNVYWWPNEQLSPEKPSKQFLEEQILLHKQTNASIPKLHQKIYDAAVQSQQPTQPTPTHKPTLSIQNNVVHHDIVPPPVSIETQTDQPYTLPQPTNAFVKQPKLLQRSKSVAAIPSGSLAEVAFSQPRPYPRLSYSLAGVNKPVSMTDKPKTLPKKHFSVKSVVRQQIDSDKEQYDLKMQHRRTNTGVQVPNKVSKSNISSVLDSLVNDPILTAFMSNNNKPHNNHTADEHKYTGVRAAVPSILAEPSYSRVASTDVPSSHMSAADIIALHNELLNDDNTYNDTDIQHTHFDPTEYYTHDTPVQRTHSRTHSAQINYTPSTQYSKNIPQYQSSVSSLSDDTTSLVSHFSDNRSINTRNTTTAQSTQSQQSVDTPQSFSSADEDTDVSSVDTQREPQHVSSIATSLLSTPAELQDDDNEQ